MFVGLFLPADSGRNLRSRLSRQIIAGTSWMTKSEESMYTLQFRWNMKLYNAKLSLFGSWYEIVERGLEINRLIMFRIYKEVSTVYFISSKRYNRLIEQAYWKISFCQLIQRSQKVIRNQNLFEINLTRKRSLILIQQRTNRYIIIYTYIVI